MSSSPKVGLPLALGLALFLLFLGLCLWADELDQAVMSCLFFAGAIRLVRRARRERWVEEFNLVERGVGVVLLVGVVYVSAQFRPEAPSALGLASGANPWLRIYPVVAAIGWTLASGGEPGLTRWWRVPFLFFFLGMPWLIARRVLDMAPVTASAVAAVLRVIGRSATFVPPEMVDMGSSSVKVNVGCSGFEAMSYLLGLSVLAVLVFPSPRRWWRVVVPIAGVALAFCVNAIRITCLCLVNDTGNRALFDSLHLGYGSQLFSGASVGLFCLAYAGLLKWREHGRWKTHVRSLRREGRPA